MRIVKKIDFYVLKSFFMYFIMTFFIVMLILLMQFMWKHLVDFVGKGVAWNVIGEFFWYASLTIVPMALPLAILLAALMAFGNFGENFELTAMKSAGVSLFRIMRSLIIFISLVVVGAFFFSNDVIPISQQKLWTLIFSLRQKSPEFDIPVGEFYNGINGVNLYIHDKDPKTKLLKNLMIYDFSNGFDNASVTAADSGRVQFTADNKYLKFTIYSGETFENLRQQSFVGNASNVPYMRQIFKEKELLIDYDNSFTRFDESILDDQHVSKNFKKLTHDIDSVSKVVKKVGIQQAKEVVNTQYLGGKILHDDIRTDSAKAPVITLDSLFFSLNQGQMIQAARVASENARRMKDVISTDKIMIQEPTMYMRRHQVERHRKFTLSFACLIFFFIGAPLGAIIRKGGLGMPVVISVLMFVVYYIIDTTGWKMAREGFWQVYQGMWLSSAILLPIGIFLTYKAVTDSALFRVEQYENIFNRIKIILWKYLKKILLFLKVKKHRINN